MQEMTDKEYLDYCESMLDTPRAGFVASNIVRLLELAGEDQALIDAWNKVDPHAIFSMRGNDKEMRELITKARMSLRSLPS